MKQKIIIHIDNDLDLESSVNQVAGVIKMGKISADGESYCYASSVRKLDHSYVVVTTDKPRKGSRTYVFYVYKESD